MSSNDLAERILSVVRASGYKPKPLRELARAMNLPDYDLESFDAACRKLLHLGRLALGPGDVIMPPLPVGRIIGTYRGNPRGFGFIIPKSPAGHDDVYVPASASAGAISGDTVLARVAKRGKRHGKMLFEGRVLEILARGQTRFVGELCTVRGRSFVIPDGNALMAPIVVRDVQAARARTGDQVVVEIVQFPTPTTEAAGVIVRVLGERGQPEVETLGVIEQFELPGEFPPEALEEARAVVDAYDPETIADERLDLRRKTIITIDPADARDFDDAISLERNNDGSLELGVHIADVAYFVREGGPLDAEARERANSVYLPGTVIPMLPELLSNGVCSLQERQPRLTRSVFITYDERGEVQAARFANSLIRSTKRLTYDQASDVLEGRPGRMSAKVVALLRDMEQLARAIRARRLRAGMLELELPEPELVFNDAGRVVDVAPADTRFSHKLIEMFMVEANEAVARRLTESNVSFLRRIHDEPGDLADGSLQRYLRVLGHPLPDHVDRFKLQALLDEVRGRPEAFPVHYAVLRSMNQAEYAPLHVGHYALASDNYCHFTSPIRRYPDLTVHRLLDAVLRGTLNPRSAPSEFDLRELGTHCSDRERRAEAAERALRLTFTLQLLVDKVGDEFEAVVTGIVPAGIFVQLERYLVDAFLPFDRLPDDRWTIDPSRAAAYGERTRVQVTVGDRLSVAIEQVDLPRRNLQVALAGPIGTVVRQRTRRPPPSAMTRTRRSGAGDRRKTPANRRRRPAPRGRSRRP